MTVHATSAAKYDFFSPMSGSADHDMSTEEVEENFSTNSLLDKSIPITSLIKHLVFTQEECNTLNADATETPLLLNFFASWSKRSIENLESLTHLKSLYPSLAILAVDISQYGRSMGLLEISAKIKAAIHPLSLDFPLAIDAQGDFYRLFLETNSGVLPTSLLFVGGMVKYCGSGTDDQSALDAIEQALLL